MIKWFVFWGVLRFSLSIKLLFKRIKSLFKYRFSHLLHQIEIVVEIVYRSQSEIGEFFGTEEMAEVGSGVGLADHTVARRIDRKRILFVAGCFDGDFAKRGKERTVSGIACRHDAVEHIDAP